jgi:hypothetical protein
MCQATNTRQRATTVSYCDCNQQFMGAWRIVQPHFDTVKMTTDIGGIFMTQRYI